MSPHTRRRSVVCPLRASAGRAPSPRTRLLLPSRARRQKPGAAAPDEARGPEVPSHVGRAARAARAGLVGWVRAAKDSTSHPRTLRASAGRRRARRSSGAATATARPLPPQTSALPSTNGARGDRQRGRQQQKSSPPSCHANTELVLRVRTGFLSRPEQRPQLGFRTVSRGSAFATLASRSRS